MTPPCNGTVCAASLALLFASPGSPQEQGPTPSGRSAQEALAARFAEHRIRLDREGGTVTFPVTVTVRDDLLEYLLVGPAGASHEALLQTDIVPSILNTALLLLGVEPGRNARWSLVEPAPTEEELAAGASPYEVHLPEGDGLFLYLAWRSGEETFFYRLEDLLRNLRTGRSMKRHRWVYLGSRMVPAGPDGEEEIFVADVESNLINLSYFPEGNTLLTGAVEDCVFQTVWLPNAWLIPPRGSELLMVLSRERLGGLPAELAGALPAPDPDGDGPR